MADRAHFAQRLASVRYPRQRRIFAAERIGVPAGAGEQGYEVEGYCIAVAHRGAIRDEHAVEHTGTGYVRFGRVGRRLFRAGGQETSGAALGL